jgi:putative copper export protein
VTELLVPPLQRGLLHAGILLLVGATTWRTFIAPGAAARLGGGGSAELAAVEHRLTRVVAVVAALLLGAWGLRLYVQLLGFRDPFVPLSEDVAFLLRETWWGTVWVAQGALLLLFALAMAVASRRPPNPVEPRVPWGDPTPPPSLPWRWRLAWVGVVGLAVTLALSSHAMSVPSNRPLAVALDGAHALAAGAWIGTLALILGPGRDAASPGGASRFAAQLHAFSPVAMVAVGVLLFAGGILSTQHVGSWGNLWGSTYGRVLLLKVGLAGAVLLLGAVNWRRGLPDLGTPAGVSRVRRRAAVEVGLAGAVLVATAVLTGLSMPEGTH